MGIPPSLAYLAALPWVAVFVAMWLRHARRSRHD
jgi:hypothetical protein